MDSPDFEALGSSSPRWFEAISVGQMAASMIDGRAPEALDHAPN
jgi:hypothetical protein